MMRNAITTLFALLGAVMLLTLNTPAIAIAGAKAASPAVVRGIFEDISLGFSDEMRSFAKGPPADFIKVRPVDLAKGKTTYIVEGVRMPFNGARSYMYWVYEKRPQGTKQIAEIGAADNVRILKSSHNGYRDIGINVAESQGQTFYFLYNGVKYIAK